MNVMQRIVALYEADFAEARMFFTGEVLPFLETFLTNTVEAELVALKPIVEAAAAEIVQDVGALASPSGWGAAIVGIIEKTVPQIEAAGLTVATASLHTAVGAALANLQAKI